MPTRIVPGTPQSAPSANSEGVADATPVPTVTGTPDWNARAVQGSVPAAVAVHPSVVAPPAPALTAPALVDAIQVIADFFGDPRLALVSGKVRQGSPEKLRQFSDGFAQQMRQLEDEYSKLKNNPPKAAEFQRRFGPLDAQLAAAGISAEELFQVASAGPVYLAARIRGAASPEEAAQFAQVDQLVEWVADRDLRENKAAASVPLDKPSKTAVPDRVEAGYQQAVADLVQGLKQKVDAKELTEAQRQSFLNYGLSRLGEIRASEMTSAFPAATTVPLGSGAWKAQMDKLLAPERTNQTMEVFTDGAKYYERMTRVIDEADSKLLVSLMKAEPDRKGLGLTDHLSARVRDARGDLSSLAVINKLAAKKLEMPYDTYMDLRVHDKMEAKDIRDLRLAQEQLHREKPSESLWDLRSPQVKARAEQLKKLPESQRKALVNQLFTHCDMRVVLDGKFPDLALAGALEGLISLAVSHSGTAWLKSILSMMRGDAESAAVAAGNRAQGERYLLDALGAPLRDIEDKAAFLRHPIRYAFGAPRDLEDLGVDVKYENKIFDKHGLHPTGVLRTQHEKVFVGKRADGTLSFVTSGNNIGAKHFAYEGSDDKLYMRFHDAGVYSVGGKGSVAEDVAQYEVTRHWNDVGSDPARQISDADAKTWLASSDAKVGNTSARLLTVEPGRSRSADAAVFAGLASANKRVVIINPFFSGDEFIKQTLATADRWKREGWDPAKPYDPKDPKSRQFIVVLPGWLDNGISQAASFKAINAMKEHGIDVRRWRPKPGATTPDGQAVYDRKAMMHTKSFTFESQNGDRIDGFTILGSMNLQNPVFTGEVRELGVYSEDPAVRAQVESEIIQPDLHNSIEAKRLNGAVSLFDRAVGLATKLWQ
jgi:hypothetical protein